MSLDPNDVHVTGVVQGDVIGAGVYTLLHLPTGITVCERSPSHKQARATIDRAMIELERLVSQSRKPIGAS